MFSKFSQFLFGLEKNIRDAAYVSVNADQEYVLSIDLERFNKVKRVK